ncbi:MAG: cobalamin-dependent protein [Magnetococcales bacterium]|nr:cobalamin-dependent protein [Magnetococcales bacterium]
MPDALPIQQDALCESFRQALASFDRLRAEELFQHALTLGTPTEMVERLIVPALEQIGGDWESGQIALSQVYMSGRLCEDLVNQMFPAEGAPVGEARTRGAIVVLRDYHMLGKRIVYSMLRTSGVHLLDYGRLDVEEVVERVIADQVNILLISVLMLPSALKVQEVRAGLEARQARVRILVGGAPFLLDPLLWREVGADAMGRNAVDGLRILRQWQEKGR